MFTLFASVLYYSCTKKEVQKEIVKMSRKLTTEDILVWTERQCSRIEEMNEKDERQDGDYYAGLIDARDELYIEIAKLSESLYEQLYHKN